MPPIFNFSLGNFACTVIHEDSAYQWQAGA